MKCIAISIGALALSASMAFAQAAAFSGGGSSELDTLRSMHGGFYSSSLPNNTSDSNNDGYMTISEYNAYMNSRTHITQPSKITNGSRHEQNRDRQTKRSRRNR